MRKNFMIVTEIKAEKKRNQLNNSGFIFELLSFSIRGPMVTGISSIDAEEKRQHTMNFLNKKIKS